MLSVETRYDSQFTSTSARSTRTVCHAELGGSDFEHEVTEDLDYDSDVYTTILLVNMTNSGNCNSNSYLPSEDHDLLTPEKKDLWGKLAPNMKHVILKGKVSNNKPNNRFNKNKCNNPNYRIIKLLVRPNLSRKLTFMNYCMN